MNSEASMAWPEIARRVKEQEPARVQANESCLFDTILSEEIGQAESRLDSFSPRLQGLLVNYNGSFANAPFEIQREIASEIEFDEVRVASQPEDPTADAFLFLASVYSDKLREREGDLFLIGAKSLEEAGDICSELLGRGLRTTLTEWCPPVFSTDL